jgi:hypothetical protein
VRARALLVAPPLATLALAEPPSPGGEAQVLQRDIARLRREAASLSGREQGLLGSCSASMPSGRSSRPSFEEVGERLAATEKGLAEDGARLDALLFRRAERARYLGSVLREIYKRGPGNPASPSPGRWGRQRASCGPALRRPALGADVRQLRAFREDTSEAGRRAEAARRSEDAWRPLRDETWRATEALAAARDRQARFLEEIRGDRARKERAAEEMEGAAREVAAFLQGRGSRPPPSIPAASAARWTGPARGRGGALRRTVDPRFGTAVPTQESTSRRAPGPLSGRSWRARSSGRAPCGGTA